MRLPTGQKIRHLLRSNLLLAIVLAIIPAAILIAFMPLNLEKYLVEFSRMRKDQLAWYEDLESDGEKEHIRLALNYDGTSYIFVRNEDREIIGQFNLDHPYAKFRNCLFKNTLDINGDGVKEVIIFTRNMDSLFMNVFDYAHGEVILENRLVTLFGGTENSNDPSLYYLADFDANGDGVHELYFSVSAGFELSPRQVFRYDFVNDSLLISLATGAAKIRGSAQVNGKGFRLLVSGSAYGNIPDTDTIAYPDSCNWIFGFDKELRFLFPPIPFGTYTSQLSAIQFINGEAYCGVNQNNASSKMNGLIRISMDGRIADSLSMPDEFAGNISKFLIGGRYLYMIKNSASEYFSFDTEEFSLKENKWSKWMKHKSQVDQYVGSVEVKADPILLTYEDGSISYYPEGLRRESMTLPGIHQGTRFASAEYYPDLSAGYLSVIEEDGTRMYSYKYNPIYAFRFAYWALFYLLSVAFVFFVLYLQRRRIHKRQLLERRVADLQLQNLRNQLDPHFAFNALNSVGNAIYKENKEKAYDLFQRFTRMIRSSLLVSDQVFRPLSEELRFTEDYLEFQKTRFRDRFDYTFDVDTGIPLDEIEIPKMLVQGFAENAVKHAFHGVDYPGQITITVRQIDKQIRITIEDNGIGIARSRELGATSGTGKGLQMVQDQVREINRLYNRSLFIEVSDRTSLDKVDSGTRTQINLPLN